MQDPAGSHVYNTGGRADVLLSSSPFHNKRNQDLAFDDSALPGFFTHHRDFFLDKDLSKDGVITVAVRDRSRTAGADTPRDLRHEAKTAPMVRPTEPTKKAYPGFPIISKPHAEVVKHTKSFNNVAGMVKDLTGTKKAAYTQKEVSFENSFGPSRPAAKSAPNNLNKKSYAEVVKQAVKKAAKKQGFIQRTLYKVDKSAENEVVGDITAAAAAAAPEAFSAAAAAVMGDKHDGGFVQTEIFSVDKTKRSIASAAAAAAAKEKSKHQGAKKGYVQSEVYSFNKLAPASAAAASKDKSTAGADSSKQNNGNGFVQMEVYSQIKNDDLAKPSNDMGFVQAEVYSKEKTPAEAASSNGDSSKKSGFTQTEMYSVNKNVNKDGFTQMELFSEDKDRETTDSAVLAAEETERGPGFVQKEVALGDALERYLPDYLYAALVHWPAAPYPKVFVTQSPWDKNLNHFKAGADFQTVMAKVSPAFRKFLEENSVTK